MMRYYDSSEQWRRFVLSVVSIAGLVLLVVSVVVGIYLMRYFISSNEGGPVSESESCNLLIRFDSSLEMFFWLIDLPFVFDRYVLPLLKYTVSQRCF